MADENEKRPVDMRTVVNKHSAEVDGLAPGAEGEMDVNNPGVQSLLDGGVLGLKSGQWKRKTDSVRPADPFGPPPIVTSPERAPDGDPTQNQEIGQDSSGPEDRRNRKK